MNPNARFRLAKCLVLAVIVFFVIPAMYAQANWNNTSFVHRSNQQILDGQNTAIKLDGVNLGGWLMWEGWIWGGGFTAEKTIYNNMQTVLGTAGANTFRDSIHQHFISRDDIREISDECFNVVRIPFNHTLLEDDFNPYVYKPAGWAVLDSILAWCEDYNVYAILDLHSAPGGQSNSFTADPDFIITLWNGAVNKNRTKRLWKAIADRYKNRGIIAGYDLLNEPDVASDSTMLTLYNGIIDSVRTVDTNHMIFIEGNTYATDFTMFSALPDQNMCFQFHFYTWFFPNSIATHLNDYTLLSNTLNVPVWCGEWGENNSVQLDTTLALLNDPAFKVSGNAIWTWKKMKYENNYPFYNGMDTTLEWNKSINWISNTSQPQPTVSEMQTGITDFLINSRVQNCTFGTTLSDLVKICTPNGLETVSSNEMIRVYPNPFSGNFVLQHENQNEFYEMVDGTGQLIYSGWEIMSQDFSALPSGLYFLKISSPGVNKTIKMIKQ
ncbi:hypothetical protein BH11BAC7_BH11BAC7_09840 [soil metagenome]